MHAALATLPQLESLFMPANVLEGVEALRTSLRRLELRSAGGRDFMITPDAVACINQLEQLNDLFFSQAQCSMDVLLHLLNTLGLQRGPTVTLHRLPLGADPMPPSEVEPLRAFAQRCASIELGEFHLSDNPSSAPALQALQLLGATAATALVWTLYHNVPEVTNSLSLRLTGLAACFDQQPPGAAPAALPEPAEVLQRALDRIPPREGWESCWWPQGWGMPALVLHGPFVGTLAYTPELVLSWLEGLTQTAVPVGEGHGSVQWLQDGGKAVFAALLLPSASAVLVVCNGGQGVAEALMAGALAAARDRPQGTLHVRPLGTGPHQPSHYISRPVQQVAQEAFSAGVGHGAARCLEWVTSLATFLQGLPAPMQHRQR
ncbi:hypothetical protein HYH03_003631 [Edaphochlamys debaryana]|uniref:Uncharacterized protein n=1 Tax=Edaphochlamys debaryana TaxID=47281 RepID=A0A836C434_9CHLO|nr:hypothetical protein HYH03_003631 [Edaphochlamys debaryana]|eukprot:KAG2498372.1 hypothetical protein HYH03_003631 [Edaphochlamys debaryana]